MTRHKSHLKHNKHENVFIQNVYNKYHDKDPLVGRVLIQCTLKDLNLEEVNQHNKYLSSNKKSMNLASCGQGMLEISEEHRQLLSISHLGYKHTEETKQKMSESRKRVKHSEEWSKNISESLKGKPHVALRGENHRLSIKIVQLSKSGEFIREWENAHTVERESKKEFSASNIRACCNKQRKTHKNFKWMNYNDYIREYGNGNGNEDR